MTIQSLAFPPAPLPRSTRVFLFVLALSKPLSVTETRHLLKELNRYDKLSTLERDTLDVYCARPCLREAEETRQIFLNRLLVRLFPNFFTVSALQ